VVSHDLKALAPLVDRVVAISFGAVIAEGSFEEVIASQKVQTAYLGQ
jgi:ABC-type branched-subunit amino acid transport system ATPase component